MSITYTIDDADLRAFVRTLVRYSPALRRNERLIQVVVVSVILTLGLAWKAALPWSVMIAVAIAAGAWIQTPKMLVEALEKQTIAPLAGDKGRGVLGLHRLSVTEAGVKDETDVGTTEINWVGIHDVISTSEHTFIFTAPTAGLIIPASKVPSDEYKSFLAELQRGKTAGA